MTSKKPTSRKAPSSRPARAKSAGRAKAGTAPATTTRSRKSASSGTAGKSRSRRKSVATDSTFAAIGEWIHEAGRKLKTTRKKVVQKAKTKIRRLLHLRPQTA